VVRVLYSFDRYGANPVCAAAACAVLDVVKEEKIMERAHRLGKVVSKHLNNIFNTFNGCIEVRCVRAPRRWREGGGGRAGGGGR
jgi:4-aminobutyrate aminotransferase-like enzyme